MAYPSIVVAQLVNRLSVDVTGFRKSLKTAQGAWADAARNMNRVGTALSVGLSVPLAALGFASVKAFTKFQDSFAGIRRTVDETSTTSFAQLSDSFRNLALQIPVAVTELNKIGEIGGQMGIGADAVVGFTRTIAELGSTTNLSVDEAAEALGQFQNVLGILPKDFHRLGSVIFELGRGFVGTETAIVDIAKRLAAVGRSVHLTAQQIFAFSTAVAGTGVLPEAGGTAIANFFQRISLAVGTADKKVQIFAKVALGDLGDATERFSKLFREKPAEAALKFFEGLARVQDAGGNVQKILKALDLEDRRLGATVQGVAFSHEQLARALQVSDQAWKEDLALTAGAKVRYQTLSSQLTLTSSLFNDIGISIGAGLAPAIQRLNMLVGLAAGLFRRLAQSFEKLSPATQEIVGWIGAFAIAIGAVTLLGSTIIGLFGFIGAGAAIASIEVALLAGSLVGLAVAFDVLSKDKIGFWEKVSAAISKTKIDLFGFIADGITAFGDFLENIELWGREVAASVEQLFKRIAIVLRGLFIEAIQPLTKLPSILGRIAQKVVTELEQTQSKARKDAGKKLPVSTAPSEAAALADKYAMQVRDAQREEQRNLNKFLVKLQQSESTGVSIPQSFVDDAQQKMKELMKAFDIGDMGKTDKKVENFQEKFEGALAGIELKAKIFGHAFDPVQAKLELFRSTIDQAADNPKLFSLDLVKQAIAGYRAMVTDLSSLTLAFQDIDTEAALFGTTQEAAGKKVEVLSDKLRQMIGTVDAGDPVLQKLQSQMQGMALSAFTYSGAVARADANTSFYATTADALQNTITELKTNLDQLKQFGFDATTSSVQEQTAALRTLEDQAKGLGESFHDVALRWEQDLKLIQIKSDLLPKSEFDKFDATLEALRKKTSDAFSTPEVQSGQQDIGPDLSSLRRLETAQKAIEKLGEIFQGVADTISQAFDRSIEGIIEGTLTVQDAFRNLARSIVLEMLNAFVKMVVDWIAAGAKQLVAEQIKQTALAGIVTAGQQTQVAAVVAGEAEKNAVVATSTATQTATTEAGVATSIAAKQAEASSWVLAEAEKLASSLATFAVVIPETIFLAASMIALALGATLAAAAFVLMGVAGAVLGPILAILAGISIVVEAVLVPAFGAMAAAALELAVANIVLAYSAAAVATAEAAESVASIPYAGPVLAIAAAAAVGASLGALIGSFAHAEGGAYLGADMPLMAHKNELVLPSDISTGLINMIQRPTVLQPPEREAYLVRDGDVHFHAHAVDAAGVDKFFRKHGKTMARSLKRRARNMDASLYPTMRGRTGF